MCVRVQHIEMYALRVARFVCVSMNLAFLFSVFFFFFTPAGSSKNSTATRARAVVLYSRGAADTCDN